MDFSSQLQTLVDPASKIIAVELDFQTQIPSAFLGLLLYFAGAHC